MTINMAMQGYMLRGQRKTVARRGDPGLPIVHVQEEGGGGLVEVAVRQQLLQLLDQVVLVRGAETAELVQQVLVQIVVEVHDRSLGGMYRPSRGPRYRSRILNSRST